MRKQVVAVVKLQIVGGQATPAPPVGPALAQHGVNIVDFTRAFNEQTQDRMGQIIPVEVSICDDRTFTFVLKTPPAAYLLKQAAGLERASGQPNIEKCGQVTEDQVREIAEIKMPDLNANDIEQAMNMIKGTARSMGLIVRG